MHPDDLFHAGPGAITPARKPAPRAAAAPSVPHQMADFALLRVAGLPFALIDALRMPATEALLDRIAGAEARMERVRQPVADALHELVPGLDHDQRLRRLVINLRRHIHNGRTNRPRAAELAALTDLLTDPARAALLQEWLAAQAELAEAAGALDGVIAEETRTVLRPALRAPLSMPHFRRAVALANPRTFRDATRERKLPRTPWPDKLERSLLGYLARAATKTSPFSSFMANVVVPVSTAADAPPPQVRRARYRSLSTLNRGAVTALAEASFAEIAAKGGLMLTVNPTLKCSPQGKHTGLCGRQITLGGRAWYEQRWAQFRLDAGLARLLEPGLSLTWPDWLVRLEGMGLPREDAAKALSQLIERGVIQPEALTDGYDPDPSAALARRWRSGGGGALGDAAAGLARLQGLALGFAETPADDRIAALEGIAALHGELAGRFPGKVAAEPLQNLVLEDCWLDGASGALGGDLLSPVTDLQDFLSGQISISPLYTRLTQAFVDVYGAGGECRDVVTFLLAVAGHLVEMPEFGAKFDAAPPVPAPVGALAPVTAHLQIARDADGSAHFVVNRVFDGGGWLASRFTLGDHPQQQRLQNGLSRWIARISGDDLPVDLAISGHCSDLQAHAPLTPMVLGWPGEPLCSDPAMVLQAERLRLRHDPETGFLRLSDDAGRGISLNYLGNTFPTPSWGVRYALSVLTRPFTVARPQIAPPITAQGEAAEVLHQPALRHGRVVLRREAWWLRSDYLARTWLAGSPAEQLRAVRRDRDRHGMPPCLFAQIHVPPQRSALVTLDMLDAYRKPIWLDSRNPFWLAMLERIARKADWIVFTRPDPDPEAAWLTVEGQRHATELHLEMMISAGVSRTN